MGREWIIWFWTKVCGSCWATRGWRKSKRHGNAFVFKQYLGKKERGCVTCRKFVWVLRWRRKDSIPWDNIDNETFGSAVSRQKSRPSLVTFTIIWALNHDAGVHRLAVMPLRVEKRADRGCWAGRCLCCVADLPFTQKEATQVSALCRKFQEGWMVVLIIFFPGLNGLHMEKMWWWFTRSNVPSLRPTSHPSLWSWKLGWEWLKSHTK